METPTSFCFYLFSLLSVAYAQFGGNTGFDLGECNTTCGFGSRVDSINCTFYPYDCYYGPPPTRVEPCFSEPCQPPAQCEIGDQTYSLDDFFFDLEETYPECANPVKCGVAEFVSTTLNEQEDTNLLPSCNMRESMEKVFNCVNIHFAGIPYSDQNTCISSFDNVIDCGKNAFLECLNDDGSTCLSIADLFPNIFDDQRSIQFFRNFTLEQLFRFPSQSLQLIYDTACPVSGSPPPEMILELLRAPFPPSLQIPVCDDGFVRDVLDQAEVYLQTFHSLETHEEFCSLWSNAANYTKEVYPSRCADLEQFLVRIFPSDYKGFAPVIIDAADIIHRMILDYNVPGCDGNGGNGFLKNGSSCLITFFLLLLGGLVQFLFLA